MMRTVRFPIAGVMVAVLIVALGLAALRNSSATWAGMTFLLTCAVLCLAIVGIVCDGNARRAWWLGFALFGWGYLLLAFWSSVELPTMAVLDAIGQRFGLSVQFSGSLGGGMRNADYWGAAMFGGFDGADDQPFIHISHCLFSLLAALIGGVAASYFFSRPKEFAKAPDIRTPAVVSGHRKRRLWPTILSLAGCAVVLFFGLFVVKSSPGYWVGLTFVVTSGLLGVTVLGAANSQGKTRQIWLGAALFGIGYMTFAFGRSRDGANWPSLPTDLLLYALRGSIPPIVSGFPTYSSGIASANARVWESLDQPVPMRFRVETRLADVLKHVQTATRGPDGKGIPIYIDPHYLQEAERSRVVIGLDGVPLKTTLRLCLQQLGLVYIIRDSLLLITSADSAVPPVYEDPFLIVGHCLLALFAAGFGGFVACGRLRYAP